MDEKENNSPVVNHEIMVENCVSDDGEGDDEEELKKEVNFIESEEILNLINEEYEIASKIDGKGDVDDDSNNISRSLTILTCPSSLQNDNNLEFPLKECTDNRKQSGGQEETLSQTETVVGSEVINVDPIRWKVRDKLCCVCNLSGKSQLGQGQFFKIIKPYNFVEEKKSIELKRVPHTPRPNIEEIIPAQQKKSASRHDSNLKQSTIDEHNYVGHVVEANILDLFDEEGIELENIIPYIAKSLNRLCSYCNRFGANVTCAFNNCDKTYHFPCSAASAGFLHLKTYSFICSTHMNHIPLLPAFNQVFCKKCDSLGDVSNLVMCSVCGNHYHGTCLGRALTAEVRTGWQCSCCRSCQVCRDSADSSKLMLCDTCDKVYHVACLRPVLTSIPKFGWKCQCCRVCSDCGSRTPGAGFSSRWHCHFTICDSCYQQRNKGFSCPLCHRAYRAGSSKDMTQCTSCKKFVHGSCDSEAQPVTYQKNMECCVAYRYVCPTCKNMHQFEKITSKKKDGLEDTNVDFNANTSHDLLALNAVEVDSNAKDEYNQFNRGAFGLGKGKPYTARKKMTFGTTKGFKTTHKGKAAASGVPTYQKKNQKIVEFGKKKCGKPKMRGVFGVPSAGLQRPFSRFQNKSISDNDNGENKIILCSMEEKFTLTQDVCAMCGALGTDQEGCLIACVQCGQCYHPYCVNIKVTKVILQRGWRCLDCSVCEGCGQRTDESRLILCDDCDISFHIYCMEPKLDCVPPGTWKCKWCAQCLTCGANEPGVNCVWLKNYTECGPCASRLACSSCQQPYSEKELIVKCENCERWLHGFCDQIRNGYEAEKCIVEGYLCILCRPKNTPPPHLSVLSQESPAHDALKLKIRPASPLKALEFKTTKDNIEHFIDGIHLSDNGLEQLTSLLNRIDANVFGLRKKKRPANADQGLDQGVLDSIESVISAAGFRGEGLTSLRNISCQVGMIVEPREDGIVTEAPEAFNIQTNEAGVMGLKRKRIRKIGVGGFNARNRTMKKESKTEDDCSKVNYYIDESYPSRSFNSSPDEKHRKKNSRIKKPKSKYAESYPSYIQDAFFGRKLLLYAASKHVDQEFMDSGFDSESFSSCKITSAATLSPDELEIIKKANAIREEDEKKLTANTTESLFEMEYEGEGERGEGGGGGGGGEKEQRQVQVDESVKRESKNETFENTPNMADNLLETIMNDGSQIDGLPTIVDKDVEEVFKNVLIDQMQDACETVLPEVNNNNAFFAKTCTSNHSCVKLNSPILNQQQVVQGNLSTSAKIVPQSPQLHTLPSSPAIYPASSTYHSEYSNSPQFSPAFSESPSSWIQKDSTSVVESAKINQKSLCKMETDESLGNNATLCSILYANINHPELKAEYPVWTDRSKQISKRWKALQSEQKQPFLSLARENRTKQMRSRKNPQATDKTVFNLQKIRESEREKHWKQMQTLRQQKQLPLPPLPQTISQLQQQINNPSEPTLRKIQSSLQLRQGLIQQPTAGSTTDNSKDVFSPDANDKEQLQSAPSSNVAALSSTASSIGPQQQYHPFPGIASKFSSSDVNQNYQHIFSPSDECRSTFYATNQNTQSMQNRPIRQGMTENDSLSAVNNNPELTTQLRESLLKHQIEFGQILKQRETCSWVQDSDRQTLDIANQAFMEKESVDARQAFANELNQIYDQKQNTTTMSRNFHPPEPVPNSRQRSLLSIDSKLPPQQIMDSRLRLLIQQQQHSSSAQQQQPQQQYQQHLQQQHRDQQQQSKLQQLHVQPQMQQHTKFFTAVATGHMIKHPSSSLQFKSSSMQNVDAELSRPTQNISDGNRMKDEFSQFNAKEGVISTENALCSKKRSNFHANHTHTEGTPESVTADLDELESDGVVTGNMSEMNALFGDLMDDELLAEMEAGFNILEYTDPELDNFASGDKTSILYDLVNHNANETTKIKKKNCANCENNANGSGKTRYQAFDSSTINTDSELENESRSTENSNLDTQISKTEHKCYGEDIDASVSNQRIRHERVAEQGVSQLLQCVNLRDGESNGNNHLNRLSTVRSPSSVGSYGSSTPIAIPLTSRMSSVVTPISSPSPTSSSATSCPDIFIASPAINETRTETPLTNSTPLPPPPYPGPPPPYPHQSEQQSMQQQICCSNKVTNTAASWSSAPPDNTSKLANYNQILTNSSSQVSRRSLLLQEQQPLMLENLLEQEKKKRQERDISPGNNSNATWTPLSGANFEQLKADVLNSSKIDMTTHKLSAQSLNIRSLMKAENNIVHSDQQSNSSMTDVHSNDSATIQANSPTANLETHGRVSVFNIARLRVPSEPPEKIVTKKDRHTQQTYENWLVKQNDFLLQQLKHYEGEMLSLRKMRKSLNSKQRGLKKQETELTEHDSAGLQRVTADMAALQKHLESSRKLCKQHVAVIQEYKSKHPRRPGFSSLPDENDALVSAGGANATSTTLTVSSARQMPATSTMTSTSRSSPTSLCRAQTEQMKFSTNSNQKDGIQVSQSREEIVASPISTDDLCDQKHIMRYPESPVKFLPSPQPRSGIFVTYQMHADSIRPPNVPILYQGVEKMLNTQPSVVSAVTAAPTNSTATSTMNFSLENDAYRVVNVQNNELARMRTIQQSKSDQQRLLQHQFAHRTISAQPNAEVIVPTKHQLRFNDAQQRLPDSNLSYSEQLRLSQQKDALLEETKNLQLLLADLTPQQKQQLAMTAHRQQLLFQPQQQQQQQQQQSSKLLMDQQKMEEHNTTSKPIQQHTLLLQQSQQNHQNEMLQQQQQQSITKQRYQLQQNITNLNRIIQHNPMIPLNTEVMQQQQQQKQNFEQCNKLLRNEIRQQDELTPQQTWLKLGRTKLLPQEFEKYGIKGGLLGGSPMWNDQSRNIAVAAEIDNKETIREENERESVPSAISESPSSASSQFYDMKEDVHSQATTADAKDKSTVNVNLDTAKFLDDSTPNIIAEDGMEPELETPLIERSRGVDDSASKSDEDGLLSMVYGGEQGSLCNDEFSSSNVENDKIIGLASDISDVDSHNRTMTTTTTTTTSLNTNEGRYSEKSQYSSDTTPDTPLRTTSVLQTTATISSTVEQESQSEEKSVVINHLVVPAHAFHSYAKMIKDGRNCQDIVVKEEIGTLAETLEQPTIENVDKPIDEEEKVNETPTTETAENSQLTEAIVTTVVVSSVTTLRTTSVVQTMPTTLQSSVIQDSTIAVASQIPSKYTEYFHSYVKKLPRAEEETNSTNEESNLEISSPLLLDDRSMKIETESNDEADGNVIVSQTLSEEKTICKSVEAIIHNDVIVASPSHAFSSTTFAKDAKLVAAVITHSTPNLSSKDGTHSPAQTFGDGILPPRIKSNDDSQNALLKQLLQNSGNAGSLTPSTIMQHVIKTCQSPINSSPPTPPNPPSPDSEITTISNMEPVLTSASEFSPIKSEMRMQYTDKQGAIRSAITTSTTTTTTTTTTTAAAAAAAATASNIAPTIASTPITTTTTSNIKQETIVSSCAKELVQVNSITQGQTVDSTSTKNPTLHIDIKRETKADELVSSQSKTSEAGNAPNTISRDSRSSVLDAQDLKKLKRRQYQAKRRQSQGKDHMTTIPKKRTRKILKIDEDYDSFVDSLMMQLRQLHPLPITEPLLINNYAVCPPFGSGDTSKITSRTWTSGELTGDTFGNATVATHDDYYNTEPFGDQEPRSPSAIPSTTRGFYNEEFSTLNLEADYEDRRLELARIDREADTPDSVLSSSSPECIIPHTPARFAGLRLIDENGSGVDSEEDEKLLKRISPVIPLVVPLALRPRVPYHTDADKENYGKSPYTIKSRHPSLTPLKDTGNLSVTLTLSSQAAQDIVGVLKHLATMLNITPPVSYKISDRMPVPGRTNPFGNKFADDVEGVDLHKYLHGSVKRCQHCRIKINDCTWVKKKASEMPFVVQDGISEDLFFCSTSCYLQMILLVPSVISEHKVSSSDDSVSDVTPRKKMKIERCNKYDQNDGGGGQTHKVTHLRNKIGTGTGTAPGYWERITPESTNRLESLLAERSSLFKGIKYRTWSVDSIPPPVQKFKTPSEKEITETLFRMGITVLPSKMPDDMRRCIFCQQIGDGVANGPSRLLNYDVDKWAHLNCSLWSDGVYETKNGALVNVDTALKQGLDIICTYCKRNGATLKCFKLRCSKVYHLSCAMKSGCWFFENKTVYCEEHLSKAESNRVLTTLAVYRRVYIDRDENRQIASVIKHAELTHLMRIGSLVFLNVGQLLPHQLQEFHNSNYIYPVGYKVIRFYWSMRMFNKRCQYVCTIHDVAGRPEFRVLIQEPGQDDLELRGASPKAVWTRILEPLANLRKTNNSVQLYPRYVSGEDLFGLTEPAIVRILENLPGIETLSDYRFKYGRNPLLELPLAINPSGCARCEPRIRGPPLKRTHTQRTSSVMPRPVLTSSPLFSGDISCPYSKHFVHSKSSQYKKMKQEWRNYVYLARSKIQGLGLYAARDIDKHTMVIEYIGEIIRSQLSDFREKQYESKNRGVYMFRLDENRVVDATICGGLARYINHSCNPNCITEKVEVDREFRIIIFSKRRIVRGEELSYDYQFDIEDDSQKIPCLCGASNCRKWMN